MCNVRENLLISLPAWQRIFAHTKTFDQLLASLHKWISGNGDKEQNRLGFIHCYDTFKHMCETDPEGIKEKARIDSERESSVKNERANALLNRYLESVRNEKI